jgi:hypothetical protein
MTCTDREEAAAFERAGDTSSAAFRAHVARCGDCAALYGAVGDLAAGAEAHPGAAALAAFDEEPASLSERARSWIASHVADCAACREVLRAVPVQGPARERRRVRLAPILAAAGWLLAAVLVFRELQPAPGPRPVVPSQTITLSQTRGGTESRIRDVEVVRFAGGLADAVEVGQTLHLRVEDSGGRVALDADVVVDELNESGWPVVAVRRSALPKGRMTVRVRAPSGNEIAAAVDG